MDIKNSEIKSQPESEIIGEIFELAEGMLDSAEYSYSKPKEHAQTIALANQVLAGIQKVHDNPPLSVKIEPRKARVEDYQLPGEHAGVWIIAMYPNNESIEINIHGGLRDPKSQVEYQDTTGRFGRGDSHEGRTGKLANKPKQINIQHKVANEMISEIWIVDSPAAGDKSSVAITSLSKKQSAGIYSNLSSGENIIFRADNQPYYKNFHSEINDISNKSINILP